MAHLTFRVSDQLASRFEAVASTRGGKSRLLRSFVESVTAAGPGSGPMSGRGSGAEADAGGGGETPRAVSSKFTLRLKDADLRALDALSREAGMRRTEWAVACLRRSLTRRPQFNPAQSEALLETRRELRRIGVQLRELVRTVRDGDVPPEGLERALREVEGFQEEVRAELEAVRSALEGEAAYWGEMASGGGASSEDGGAAGP